jgi:DNA mismatch repair ATPase MutL
VHHNGVVLRLNYTNMCDINTSGSIDRVTTIRQLYKLPRMAEECITVNHSSPLYTLDAVLTTANYSGRLSALLLFINGRMVEMDSVKNLVRSVYYSSVHLRIAKFVYISL